MRIETTDLGSSRMLALSGEIDMYSSPEFRKALMQVIKQKPPEIIVDFGGVTYIDSSGIATLVEALKAMKAFDGKLKLATINDHIMDIFKFTKLDTVFNIYGNVDEAMKG